MGKEDEPSTVLISRDEIFGETAEAKLTIKSGKVVTFIYWPDAISGKVKDQMVDAGFSTGETCSRFIYDFVKAWDFSVNAGEVYSLEVDELNKLPLVFLRMMVGAILESAYPNLTTSV